MGIAFPVANYIFLALYSFLLISFMRISADTPESGGLMEVALLLSPLIIIINCLYNISVFRKRSKLQTISTFYLVSAIMFVLSLCFFAIIFGTYIKMETDDNPDHSGNEMMLFLLCINIAVGLFIFLTQLRLWSNLKKNSVAE